MLIAFAALPHSREVAVVLFALGATYTLAFAVWRTGGPWKGGREHAATTPVLYLPTVAGINPDLERYMSKRTAATTIEVNSSHLSLISHPEEIADLIMRAASTHS